MEPVFGGKRANLEAQAAQKTQDTKNALFGVRRFQRFLLQKRSGDEAVTSLVTSSAGWKLCSFGAFWDQKSPLNQVTISSLSLLLRSSRPRSSGSSKTTPTSSSTTRTSPTGARLPSADQRGEELQPSVRRRAAAGGRGLHDRPQHGGPRDPAEAGAAGAAGRRAG